MQDLEQHMEDWFRKAADACPIKAPPSDWEQIASRLTGISESRKKKNERRWMLILLLSALLVSTGITMLEFLPFPGKSINNLAQINQGQKASVEKMEKKFENTIAGTPLTSRKDEVGNLVPAGKKAGRLSDKTFPVTLKGDLENAPFLPGIITNDKVEITEMNPGLSMANIYSNQNGFHTKEISLITPLAPCSAPGPYPELLSKSLIKPSNHIGFYWGLLAGPQFSRVKDQGITKPGFDAGLMIGYAVNKRISFETGLIYSSKHYTSEGKYFDMTKAAPNMPQGMKVMSLEGNSSMFEIPLQVKINILPGKKSGIYLSSGISSRLIIHESNQYSALVNGSPEQMTGTYPKNTTNFASSLNIGAGFEHALGKRGMIRLEPYVNLPIKGTGVGNMPVTSAGLRFSLIQFTK